MDCQHVSEVLPWFVNRTLAEEERRRVEDHLATCRSCSTELQETHEAFLLFGEHVASEDLIDFAMGRFSRLRVPQGLVESHLARCSQCEEELKLVQESRAMALEGQDRPSTEGLEPLALANVVSIPKRNGNRRLWRSWAVAASVGLALCTAGWVWTWWRGADAQGREQHALQERIASLEQANADLRESQEHSEELELLRADRQRLDRVLEEQGRQTAELAELEERLATLRSPRPNVGVVEVFPSGTVLRGREGRFEISSDFPRVVLILTTELREERVFADIVDEDGNAWPIEQPLELQQTEDYAISLDPTTLPQGKALTLRLHLSAARDEAPLETYRLAIR